MTTEAEKPIEVLRQKRNLESGETVLLRTGIEEVKPLVKITMVILKRLYEEKPIVLYELAQLCRDRDHEPWGKCGDDLVERKLIQKTENGYHVHDSIRNIVLAAIDGEGVDMVLRSPLAPKDP
jgi:hypothetical protein